MKNIQMITKFSALFLLLCFALPRLAVGQTSDTDQGLWWGVERGVEGKDWTTTASVSEVGRPHVVVGRTFTIKDSLKFPTGQFSARGAATQESFTMILDANLSTKNGSNSVRYNFEPVLYVEHGANARLRVTIKAVSKAEAKVNAPQKNEDYSGAVVTVGCLAVAGKNALQGSYISLEASPRRSSVTNLSKPTPDTPNWNDDVSFESTHTISVGAVGNTIHNGLYANFVSPALRKVAEEKKDVYRIEFGNLIESLYEKIKPGVKPEVVNLDAYAYGDGEASITLKQEFVITIERVGQKTKPKPQPPIGSAAIGVDLNRDGPIDFDKADKTSAAKPFRFWLNNDSDAYVEKEEDQQDVAAVNGPDCADNKIAVTRDLEDFARLHVQAPSGFKPDGTWRCTMNFTDATGNPAIRLWNAIKPGTEYLTDPTTAQEQLKLAAKSQNGANNWPVGASIREIPLSLFKAAGGDKYRAEFIFEAMRAGKGAVQVHFFHDGKEQLAQNPVWLDLHPIGDFYDYYQLPSVDLNGVMTTYEKTLALPAVSAEQSSDYILFVHGWRMQEWSKKAAAETAYKRLWQRGYKGKFGLFSWPTEYVEVADIPKTETNRRNYDRSEQKAWFSAASLRNLLISLNVQSPQKSASWRIAWETS